MLKNLAIIIAAFYVLFLSSMAWADTNPIPVLSASWDETITPINTCGQIVEHGEAYQKVLRSNDLVMEAVIAAYRAWTNFFHHQDKVQIQSSPLYDTLAFYLAFSQADVKMEQMPILVNDEGKTLTDPAGKKVVVTSEWKTLAGFEELLAKRLTEPR